MATKVEVYRGHDFIIHEEDYRTTRIEGVVTNDTGAVARFQGGMLLEGTAPNFVPFTNANLAVTGILVHASELIDAAGTQKLAIMVNGPAVVDGSSLMDVTGAAADAAALVLVETLGIKLAKDATLIEEGRPAI